MKFIFKLTFKIIAIPFVVVLTILSAVIQFFFMLSELIFIIVSFILGIGGAILLFTGDTYGGIGVLVIAFLVSPFGLPAVAEWIAKLLDGLNYSLKCFITS